MSQKKSSQKFYRIELSFINFDEIKFEILNNFLIENGYGSIEEEIISDSKSRYFIYLPVNNFQGHLNKLRKYSDEIDLPIKILDKKLIDDSYLYNWQKYFTPEIIKNLIIKPSWMNLKIVEINPQNAFGTGKHPTTRLCIESIITLKEGFGYINSLIDCGCGSGILSIVAEKYGFKKIVSFDIDPSAVMTAKLNVERNGCRNIFIYCGTFNALNLNNKYDVVVANILSNVILQNAKILIKILNNRGFLILSGIEQSEIDEFLRKFPQNNLNLYLKKEMDGWICLIYRKDFSL